ncbi:MAG: glutamine--fructose-6-phosphate transaminase (isomerizing), partial [Oceanibaculum sp.]
MCGIIGVVGKTDVVPSLIEGLKRLEYRGYDSAGIATLVKDGIERRRSEGKIARLEEKVAGNGIHGDIGIGHTRWATHGVPNERNAHPHATDRVALVHNGIIENYRELAAELSALGHVFASETDSEIAAHLITRYLNEGMTPQQAVATAIRRMDGAYALAILFRGEHDLIVGARKGSPLAVGWGEGEMYLGSDALALSPFARRISYLEEGDWVEISRAGAIFHDEQDRVVDRPAKPTALSGAMIGKGNYPHFMLKEIYEQPGVIGDTLRSMWNPASGAIDLPPLDIDLAAVSRITLVACGTSYLGAMVAKYWFEKVARIAADIDIASEFRYRDTPLEEGGLAIFISQSGETIDTLAALRHAKEAGQKTIAIVNVPESTMAREADAVLPTLAGPEIGVASTKAFTCQLVLLACLVIATARARGAISGAEEARLSNAIAEVPSRAAEVLNGDEAIQALAAEVAEARDVLYIGRNTGYPIAL